MAVRHAADHIHLVATLARQDGARPKMWNDCYRIREACKEAEHRLRLRVTAPGDRTAARRATRAETEQAARRGWGEPPRATLRRKVCTAAAGYRIAAGHGLPERDRVSAYQQRLLHALDHTDRWDVHGRQPPSDAQFPSDPWEPVRGATDPDHGLIGGKLVDRILAKTQQFGAVAA